VPFGNRAILFPIGAIAVFNIATTAVMISRRSAAPDHGGSAKPADHLALGTRAVVLIVAAFVLLPAVNATVTSIMTVFVTETMRIDVIWAGIALGVAAGLEVPALILIGRLSLRFSSLRLIVTGVRRRHRLLRRDGLRHRARHAHRPPTAQRLVLLRHRWRRTDTVPNR
jgi:SET family sugar efflux transporter-like MFS transporter